MFRRQKEGRMKESELERKFRIMVQKAGGRAYKFVSPGNDGVPDRLVVLPGGRIGFVELKRKGGAPGKQQQYRMKELEDMGCFTAVVDDLEKAEEVLAKIRKQVPQLQKTDSLFLEMVNRRPHTGNGGEAK